MEDDAGYASFDEIDASFDEIDAVYDKAMDKIAQDGLQARINPIWRGIVTDKVKEHASKCRKCKKYRGHLKIDHEDNIDCKICDRAEKHKKRITNKITKYVKNVMAERMISFLLAPGDEE